MATNFPTALDTLTNPTAGQNLNNPSHSGQHADANDAIEALEAKVGANGSAVTTSHDYKLGEVTGSDKSVGKSASQTLTNKILSSGVKLDENADKNITQYGISRQAIVNGNFDVWQRGSSIAMTTENAYTADRWYCETATAGTDKTVSLQDGSGVLGSVNCARVAMVQDIDELLTFSQALESQDSIKFRGKKLTLSFYARGGAQFVADNPTLVCKIKTGKGTDQKVLGFTTSEDAVSENKVLTTDWQKFTLTTTNVIASDITQIGISFAFTHAGSGIATNYFEIAQVQLCEGDVPMPFSPKSYEEELRICQRYYEEVYSTHYGFGNNACFISVDFFYKVRKRTTPTVVYSNGSLTNCAFNTAVANNVNHYCVAYNGTSGTAVTMVVSGASVKASAEF